MGIPMPYRGVVRHVRYWRGDVHRWSTVYPFLGTLTSALTSSDAETLLLADDKMCFGINAGDGGTYECDLYDTASGGVPVASYIAFDWTTPGSWIKYGGAAWTGGTVFETQAETSLAVTWPAGLSRTGKPVVLRKWYHAVPVSVGTAGQTPDIATGNLTSLKAQAVVLINALSAKGLVMGSASGRFAGTVPVVSPFYENHQMPRGRRRKALVTASGRYTGPSVVIGPSLPQTDGGE
jgi:hypothetical protein